MLNSSSFLRNYGIKLNTQERNEIEESISTLLLNESFNSSTQPFFTTIPMETTEKNKNQTQIGNLCSFSIHSRVNSTQYLDLVKTIEINSDNKKISNFKPVLIKPVFKLYKLENVVTKSVMDVKLGGEINR